MFETPETILIPVHPPICEEMKLYSIEEKPMTGRVGEISEWAARKALWDYPEGSEQSLEEVTLRAHNIQIGIALNHMVDQGLVDMEWCEEHGEMMFSLTLGGKEWVNEKGQE